MVTNWMTTVPGVLALLSVLWNAWQTRTLNIDELQTALVGIGLVFAKDWNVTGGHRKQ